MGRFALRTPSAAEIRGEPRARVAGFRSSFDAQWPRIEAIGLRLTGVWIAFLGFSSILGNADSNTGAILFAYPAGAALILAGILTVDRSREDLVTWTVTGIAAIVLAFSITASTAPDPEALSASAYPFVLVLLGFALFGLRTFRGAFRRRRDPTLAPIAEPR